MSPAASTARDSSGETENALRYRCIIDAVRLINKNKQQVHEEEALGMSVSPAWRLLNNAANHLLKQAHTLLRGDVQE
jgi:hypothetical protein